MACDRQTCNRLFVGLVSNHGFSAFVLLLAALSSLGSRASEFPHKGVMETIISASRCCVDRVRTIPSPSGALISLDRSGMLLATKNHQNQVGLWNASTGEPIRSYHLNAEEIGGFSFSGDGLKLAFTCAHGKLPPQKKIEMIPFVFQQPLIEPVIRPIAFSVIDVATGRELVRTGAIHDAGVQILSFMADDELIGSIDSDYLLSLTKVSDGSIFVKINDIHHDKFLYDTEGCVFAFSSGRTNLRAVADRSVAPPNAERSPIQSYMYLWDIGLGRVRRENINRFGFEGIYNVALSPDGDTAAIRCLFKGDRDRKKRLVLIDFNSLTMIRRFDCSADDIKHAHYFSFSPDGSKIIMGGYQGTIQIWDCRSGKRVLSQALLTRPTKEIDSKSGFLADRIHVVRAASVLIDGLRVVCGGRSVWQEIDPISKQSRSVSEPLVIWDIKTDIFTK
jgi:WD40 repeat protein